ncbi:hypothetical protein ACTAQJ_07985 [Arthrobacter sp. alpha11c]
MTVTRYPHGSLEYWKKLAATRQDIITRAHRKLNLLQQEYDEVEAELRTYVGQGTITQEAPINTTEGEHLRSPRT